MHCAANSNEIQTWKESYFWVGTFPILTRFGHQVWASRMRLHLEGSRKVGCHQIKDCIKKERFPGDADSL